MDCAYLYPYGTQAIPLRLSARSVERHPRRVGRLKH
jgi:hypothetical protein